VLGFVIAAGCAGSGAAGVSSTAGADWTRFGYDASRSGDDPNDTGVTAANVALLVRQQIQLPGTVDSSPVYLKGVTVDGSTHDTLFVTTSYGLTLAIDARTGSTLWQYTPPSYARLAGSRQITTAGPVADPSRKWIYAASPDGKIQKLSVAGGSVAWRSSISWLPVREKISSSLNLANGNVIATTSSFSDKAPYQGHVVLISSGGRRVHVWNALCSNRARLLLPSSCDASDAGIWGRGGAAVMPGSGNLLVATGNAPWNGTTNWGDSVIELSPSAKLIGNYTPTNTAKLYDQDLDLGSASPVYLTRSLIAQGGKDGVIRLLSIAKLHGTDPHQGHEVQKVSAPGKAQLFAAPAVWRQNHVWLIVADKAGTQAWVLRHGRLQPKWQNSTPGTSPVIAGGLLYVYDGTGGALNIYEPASGQLVTSLAAGTGHWSSPIATDGLVALPEGNANLHATTGVLDIWRLP
jgi:putative pyrroloquinoline-quinone binding quinoprotein